VAKQRRNDEKRKYQKKAKWQNQMTSISQEYGKVSIK